MLTVNKYILTSTKSPAQAELWYGPDGDLVGGQVLALGHTPAPETLVHLVRLYPTEADLVRNARQNGHLAANLGYVPTFEEAWLRYNDKRDRLEALAVWKKMVDKDKVLAFNGMDRYKAATIRAGVAQKMFKTYLRQMPWADSY